MGPTNPQASSNRVREFSYTKAVTEAIDGAPSWDNQQARVAPLHHWNLANN
jgi:hypothetical protein